jgi:hypothetical protein
VQAQRAYLKHPYTGIQRPPLAGGARQLPVRAMREILAAGEIKVAQGPLRTTGEEEREWLQP